MLCTRYYYNAWRPVTAIRRPDIWLPTGKDVSDPEWTPLLTPTPNHQDYLSTHATFGGAAGAVIRNWNGGDAVDVFLSSNVTVDGVGVITRNINSIKQAVKENGNSRVFGGVSYEPPNDCTIRSDVEYSQIHFQYATDTGSKVGDWVGRVTLENFDKNWDKF